VFSVSQRCISFGALSATKTSALAVRRRVAISQCKKKRRLPLGSAAEAGRLRARSRLHERSWATIGCPAVRRAEAADEASMRRLPSARGAGSAKFPRLPPIYAVRFGCDRSTLRTYFTRVTLKTLALSLMVRL